MHEGFTELPKKEAYIELRRILLDMNCQLVFMVPPDALEVRQGSWFGLTPVSMAKHLRFRLYGQEDGTLIKCQAFWPAVLVASLVVFYTACLALITIAATVITQFWTTPLLSAPFSFVILGLMGLIALLALLHVYAYLRRTNALTKVLRILKARGSILHRSVRAARIRKGTL
jgi:hypothetical protein